MSLSARAKEVLEQAIAGPHAPTGLVFGAIGRDGNILVAEAAGRTVLNKTDPMSIDSYFPLYSATKVITGIAAMQLVEQGKLALDEPVERYVPEIGKLQVLGVDGSMRAPKSKITLRMLLTHTAGFGYTFHNDTLHKLWKSGGPDELSGTRVVLDLPLVYEPGEAWNYSTAIDWVGEVIERVSGQKLSQYCAEHIFGPLGIQDITFSVSPEQRERLVSLHRRLPDGTLEVIEHMPFVHSSSYDSGGAGAFGTLRSFLTILAPLINGGIGPNGAQILQAATVRTMFENQVGRASGPHGTYPSTRKELTGDIVVPESMRFGWGFTFLLNLDPLPTGRSAMSGSWGGLPNISYSVDPTRGVACVMLCQLIPFGDAAVMTPFMSLEGAVHASLA